MVRSDIYRGVCSDIELSRVTCVPSAHRRLAITPLDYTMRMFSLCDGAAAAYGP